MDDAKPARPGSRRRTSMRVMKLLPHRYPFLLVDRIIDMDGDESCVGIKNVTINEPFFQGHFPQYPGHARRAHHRGMAQTAGALCVHQCSAKTTHAAARVLHGHRQRQVPQAGAARRSAALSRTQDPQPRPRVALHGEAKVDGQIVAEAEISAMIVADTAEARAFAQQSMAEHRIIHPTAIVEDGRQTRRRRRDRPLLHVGRERDARRRRRARQPRRRRRPHHHRRAHAHLSRSPRSATSRRISSTRASRRRSRSAPTASIREGVTMNPGTEGGGMSTTVGDNCTFLANSPRRPRLPRRQQRHLLQQRHAGRPLHGRRLRHHRRRRGACIQFARVGAHAFLGGMSGLENDPHSLRHGARQSRASVGPQHRRPAAARLFARRHPRSAPRLPPAVRRRGHADGAHSTTSRRSSPTIRSCRRSSPSSAPAASAPVHAEEASAEAMRVAREAMIRSRYHRASSALWQAAAACRARSPSTSRRAAAAVHIVAIDGEADRDLSDFPLTRGQLGADRRHGARLRNAGVDRDGHRRRGAPAGPLAPSSRISGSFSDLPAIARVVAATAAMTAC